MNQVIQNNKFIASDVILGISISIFLLHTSPYIGSIMPMPLYAGSIIIAFLFLFFEISRTKNPIGYLLPIVILPILTESLGVGNDLLHTISSMLQFFIYPMATFYIMKKGHINYFKYYLGLFLLIQVVTGISSIIGFQVDPNLVRTNFDEENIAMNSMKANMNIGDLYMANGYSVALPIAFIFFRWRKSIFKYNSLARSLSIISIPFILYVVYICQYTINLTITFFLFIILFFSPQIISKKYFNRSLLISAIIIVLGITIGSYMLQSVADMLGDSVMADRLNDAAAYLQGNSNSIDDRSDFAERQRVYETSITNIFKYFPIGGWSQESAGGHSFILDSIARFGLLGFCLLIWYYRVIIKRYINIFEDQPWIYYMFIGLFAITIDYIFNPGTLYREILFLYPLSGAYIKYAIKENENSY